MSAVQSYVDRCRNLNEKNTISHMFWDIIVNWLSTCTAKGDPAWAIPVISSGQFCTP